MRPSPQGVRKRPSSLTLLFRTFTTSRFRPGPRSHPPLAARGRLFNRAPSELQHRPRKAGFRHARPGTGRVRRQDGGRADGARCCRNGRRGRCMCIGHTGQHRAAAGSASRRSRCTGANRSNRAGIRRGHSSGRPASRSWRRIGHGGTSRRGRGRSNGDWHVHRPLGSSSGNGRAGSGPGVSCSGRVSLGCGRAWPRLQRERAGIHCQEQEAGSAYRDDTVGHVLQYVAGPDSFPELLNFR